jgi:hypothetical protein
MNGNKSIKQALKDKWEAAQYSEVTEERANRVGFTAVIWFTGIRI